MFSNFSFGMVISIANISELALVIIVLWCFVKYLPCECEASRSPWIAGHVHVCVCIVVWVKVCKYQLYIQD